MIKKFLSLVCAIIMFCLVACKSNKIDESESVVLSDVALFLQVVQSVEDAESFYCVAEGYTKSLGIKQQISARRYVVGDSMFKESISYSKLVKVAAQVYVKNGKYLVREGEDINSITSVTWQDYASDLGREEYLSRYGAVILGLNNYIMTADTIDKISVASSQDGKVFTAILNVETATKNIVKEMKTNAGSKDEPVFKSAKLTLTTNSSLEVVSVRYECVYDVEIVVLGKVECEEDITEYFYGFNTTASIPEGDFFLKYI